MTHEAESSIVQCETCSVELDAARAAAVHADDAVRYYCSSRCADAAEAVAGIEPTTLPKRIVVPFDGSGPALRAVAMAIGLAKRGGGSITIVHAIDMTGMGAIRHLQHGPDILGRLAIEVEQALRADAEAQLRPVRRLVEAHGIDAAEHIAVGPATDAIAEQARDADLVVMGSRGLGPLSGALLGSVAHRVLGTVTCPVTIVP